MEIRRRNVCTIQCTTLFMIKLAKIYRTRNAVVNHFGLFVVDSVNPSFHTDRRVASIHFGSAKIFGEESLYYARYIHIRVYNECARAMFFYSFCLRRKRYAEKSHTECRVPKIHLSLTTHTIIHKTYIIYIIYRRRKYFLIRFYNLCRLAAFRIRANHFEIN